MTTDHFGRRFLSDREFLQYAASLDLFADGPSPLLLEFAERLGVLNPVARIRFPPEIARRWHKDHHADEVTIIQPIEGNTSRLRAASELRRQIYHNLWRNPVIYGERDHPLDVSARVTPPSRF
jgi:hypothetical protein